MLPRKIIYLEKRTFSPCFVAKFCWDLLRVWKGINRKVNIGFDLWHLKSDLKKNDISKRQVQFYHVREKSRVTTLDFCLAMLRISAKTLTPSGEGAKTVDDAERECLTDVQHVSPTICVAKQTDIFFEKNASIPQFSP